MDFTFVSGNMAKVKYLERFLGQSVEHHKINLDEIQSLDPTEVIEHKVKQAYKLLNKPVLIEDTSLVFNALGKLPGPFIKFFLEELGNDGMCKMLDVYDDRSAEITIIYCLYDGNTIFEFTGEQSGKISSIPKGKNGHGWDPIFIPKGANKTYASMNDDEYADFSARNQAVKKLKKYLVGLNR